MKGLRSTELQQVAWIPPALVIALVLIQLWPLHGYLGHDYYHFFARLYIGALYFWQNGLAVPHYTPSLCGGIPFFADPQSVYYSLPQLFALFVDPLYATLATVLLMYIAGYMGFYRLGRLFGFRPVAAHAGALLFILNGFSFAHLFVGHITHHSFLLFPWLLLCLFRSTGRGRAFYKNVALFSLILIYTFYSGGMHMLVVFAVGFVLAFPFLLELRHNRGEGRELWGLLGLSVVCFLFACSGKLIASALFSQTFVHRAIDSSGAGILTLVSRYFWFDPARTPLYLRFGGMHFGPWEYVGFLSKLTLPGLFLFPLLVFRRQGTKRIGLTTVYVLLSLLVCILASGNSFNRSLPFFRNYHNPIKILAAFIPFLCLMTAYVIDGAMERIRFRLSSQKLEAVFYLTLALLLVGEFEGYASYFVHHKPSVAYPYDPTIYTRLRAIGRLPPVTQVIPLFGADDIGLVAGCTSLRCYEPMFGYHGETMRPQLVLGPTGAIRDGRFNISHPGCFLYPGYFGCRPWDRIPASQGASFQHFIRGDAQAFGVPPWQEWLLRLNFFCIGLLLLVWWGDVLGWALIKGVISTLRGSLGRVPTPTERGI